MDAGEDPNPPSLPTPMHVHMGGRRPPIVVTQRNTTRAGPRKRGTVGGGRAGDYGGGKGGKGLTTKRDLLKLRLPLRGGN